MAQPISFESLSYATLLGVQDIPGPIQLQHGLWKGSPVIPGGTERPSVTLNKDLILSGDVDGDGLKDGAAFVISSLGGSGVQLSVAVFMHRGNSIINIENVLIGERIQIFDAEIDSSGIVLVTLVRAGDGDDLCCPGEIVQRRWQWNRSRLKELPLVMIGRLSVAALEGGQWRLESWKSGEPVDTNSEVSLRFSDGRMSGHSGCNRYFAAVKDGNIPGAITINAAGATKMMCSSELMKTEDRFLRLLPSIVHFRYIFSKLHLEYAENGIMNSLIFRREPE
ncbi:MAG: META domain-containing protein [Bacteroidetes bacterium]|nr:META domain-containing protein [Bacteroidota bacterium]